MVNESASFGAADTGETEANRWATDFAPCVSGNVALGRTWVTVQEHIEDELLPAITNMRPEISARQRFFEGSKLEADDQYTCIRHGIMVDPVHSSKQKSHIDIANQTLEKEVGAWNIWNIFIPIQVVEGHPETAVHDKRPESNPYEDFNVGANDIYFFDGMKNHYGRGNVHTAPRILIHLVYVQTKLLQHPLGREEISQQYQPAGIRVSANERDIFDSQTLVGKSGVASKLSQLGIQKTAWEFAGGLNLPYSKKNSWGMYSFYKEREREEMELEELRRDRVDVAVPRDERDPRYGSLAAQLLCRHLTSH